MGGKNDQMVNMQFTEELGSQNKNFCSSFNILFITK